MRHPAKAAGFTLVELMIVLAIAGLALALALPGFRGMTERRQLNAAAIDMLHAIHLTRSEALRRNRIVQLAPLDDADWALGWRIYASNGANGPYRDGDTLILQRAALPAGIRVESHTSSPSDIQIAYNGGGRCVRRSRMMLSGSWYLHLKRETRVIAINFQGRARLCDPTRGRACESTPR